jgi:2-isopropylmalate synthase
VEYLNVAEGAGPVDAIYNAMRKVLLQEYCEIQNLHLNDYKVRIIDSGSGTSSRTLVLIEFMNIKTQATFTTVGVSENIIDASFIALNDGIVYFLDFSQKADYPQSKQ